MGRSKLKSLLDKEKGRDLKLEKQKKKQKEARKKKEQKTQEDEDGEDEETGGVQLNGGEPDSNGKQEKKNKKGKAPKKTEEAEQAQWETDEDESEDDDDIPDRPAIDFSRIEDSDSEASYDDDAEEDNEEEVEDEEEEDDIALSDIESLASEDKGDIIPHQRLTINNTAALTAALNRISLPYSKITFSEHQSVMTDEPVEIPDVEDDLNRELAFYKQSLSAVKEARQKLKKEGVPFSRPADYFAEMVKSEEHMGKVKKKLIDEAASKKASAEARKQRDLKKFGKQVQVAKLQERAKEKRDTLEKISLLKRKRQGADLTATNEEDLFDVELDKAAKPEKGGRDSRPSKRQKKDAKFGFGGKKRHAKSNDAKSSSDMSGYSAKKMKAGKLGPKTGASKRLGKNRRAKRA